MEAMDEPTGSAPDPVPGDRRPVLERPPSDRYAEPAPGPAGPPAPPGAPGQLSPGVLVALAGAILVGLLGGLLSITAGLVVVAAGIGWLVGTLVRPARPLAVGLAVGSAAVGLAAIWLVARAEGGVLGPLDYLAAVHGPLALLQLVVAGATAWLRAR